LTGLVHRSNVVIPAQAGIHHVSRMDSRLRGNDKVELQCHDDLYVNIDLPNAVHARPMPRQDVYA